MDPLSPPQIPNIHVDDTVLSMENLSALIPEDQQLVFRKISQESQNSQDSCHDENGAIAKGELDVRVKKSELKRSHSSVEAGMPEYKMMAYPRGLALIIEIEEFQNQIASRRHGSHVDILNLKKLFEQLHFKIDHHQNLNRMDFLKQLDIFAAAPEHRDADMMILVILSHGRDSAIIAADGRIIHTEDIYSRFNNSNCPALLGKPKFFIVQACRGEETDRSNMMDYQEDELMHESGGNGNELKVKRAKRRWDACDQDSIPITMEPLDQCRPTWEDMIIAYSTIPGYTSQRDPQEGTWFIQSLVEIFMNHSHEKELIDLLRMTSDYLSKFTNAYGDKQTCNVEMRHLYKRIYFNPGVALGGTRSRQRRVSGTQTQMSPKATRRRSFSTPPTSPLTETANNQL